MSIYKPPPSRWKTALAVGLVTFVVGLLIGTFLLGSKDADPQEAISDVSAALRGAASTLEIVGIEYREAVESDASREHQAATDALDRSRARWADAEPALRALDPERANEIDAGYSDLEGLLSDNEDPDQVDEEMNELRELLTGGG